MLTIKKPKYQIIKEDLSNLILSQHYKRGDRFFTESELIEKYQVSSITVIRALKELEKEGYITRKQGLGTFIENTTKDRLVHFSYNSPTRNLQEEIQVLSLTKGNNPTYLKQLGLHKSEFYYTLCRKRLIDGQPYLYQESYIPHDFILNPEADLSVYNSLYNRFFVDYNIQMAKQPFSQKTDIKLECPSIVRDFFKLASREPCVRQIKVTRHQQTGRILEYALVYKHWKFFSTEIQSSHF
ncbi:GntR family transcriptional regulator [Streptococcus parauberis]|uniref:Transcriptional regulator, GntR family n=3 Tax=Streptococcus parauberis TaxID=1348 RepID=F1YXY7_9STRE|nr:GntR family transcriptional regulator [Streptococcus parauberis]AEF24891.1 GntR family regulatory protein [Streptococcus parauberis KCTC 11537]AUT05666.1 Histidine utilization repressor [Streptococcus parauberis]EGE53142.1 transcriptional regulator, GntR family [Streptococcus parauberis NCFD 2020]EMF49471.1 Transcriptional regulator, GntR family [Streptococcus parauberis KRS-02109]EMG26311.1 Transcriptional regulator, GntR family [Streptococcus parauberis KRS-02083]